MLGSTSFQKPEQESPHVMNRADKMVLWRVEILEWVGSKLWTLAFHCIHVNKQSNIHLSSDNEGAVPSSCSLFAEVDTNAEMLEQGGHEMTNITSAAGSTLLRWHWVRPVVGVVVRQVCRLSSIRWLVRWDSVYLRRLDWWIPDSMQLGEGLNINNINSRSIWTVGYHKQGFETAYQGGRFLGSTLRQAYFNALDHTRLSMMTAPY